MVSVGSQHLMLSLVTRWRLGVFCLFHACHLNHPSESLFNSATEDFSCASLQNPFGWTKVINLILFWNADGQTVWKMVEHEDMVDPVGATAGHLPRRGEVVAPGGGEMHLLMVLHSYRQPASQYLEAASCVVIPHISQTPAQIVAGDMSVIFMQNSGFCCVIRVHERHLVFASTDCHYSTFCFSWRFMRSKSRCSLWNIFFNLRGKNKIIFFNLNLLFTNLNDGKRSSMIKF